MLITLPGVSSLTYYKLRTRPCHTLVQHLPWVLIACKIKSNIFIYLEIKKWASTYGWCVISCHLLSTFSVPNTLHPHHKMVQDSHCQNTWFYAAWHCSLHILATFKMVIFLTTPQEFRFKSVQWGLGIRFFHKPPAWIWDEVHRYHLGNTQFSSLPGGHVLQPGRYFCTLLDTAERLTMFSWLSRTKIISSLCTSVVFYPNFH